MAKTKPDPLIEWETRVEPDLCLSDHDDDLLSKLGKKKIEIIRLAKGLQITTTSYVGSIAFEHFELHIRPKIKIESLCILFCYAYDIPKIEFFDEKIEQDDSFADVLIRMLLEEVRTLERRGLFQEYRQHCRNLEMLRGRIDFNALFKRGGVPSATLPCRFYNRSLDNPLNQMLCAGLRFCAGLTLRDDLRFDLLRLHHQLAELVTDAHLTRQVIEKAFRSLNRLNFYYEPALRLIRLLFELTGGFDNAKEQQDIMANGFLFDMNILFERVLGKFFRENFSQYDLTEQEPLSVYRGETSDDLRTVKPDYVFHNSLTNAIELIADAKYIDMSKNILRSELYQLSVYASVCPSRRSVLLYPANVMVLEPKTLTLHSLDGVKIASVKIQPVDMCELVELIRNGTTKKRQDFAKELLQSPAVKTVSAGQPPLNGGAGKVAGLGQHAFGGGT